MSVRPARVVKRLKMVVRERVIDTNALIVDTLSLFTMEAIPAYSGSNTSTAYRFEDWAMKTVCRASKLFCEWRRNCLCCRRMRS